MILAAFALAYCLVADGEPAPDPAGQEPTATSATTVSPAPLSLRYPLGERAEPDLLAPGEPFKLVDLRYGFVDTNGTTHSFAARVKAKDWGYLEAKASGERRSLQATTQRLSLGLSSEQGSWSLGARYRARWLIASADALARPDTEGGGWRIGPAVRVRLSPDLELVGGMIGDTAEPDDRFLRALSTGFLWQWQTKLEMEGEYRREYVSTDALAENTVDQARLSVVAQWGPAELRADGTARDTDGRFPRREMEGAMGARVAIGPRLLAEALAGGSLEKGASTQGHLYRGAITWFGRRFTLPRAGEAAEHSLRIARAATAAGYNERRVFDDDGLRAQRERLALSPTRGELRADLSSLYHAQVEERPVPVLGLEVSDRASSLSGESLRVTALFVGLPWPPAPPWRANEAAVPFLRLGYAHERRISGPDFIARAHRLTLTVALDREMDLVLGWRRAEPTALDLIRGIGRQTTFEASYVYAFGR